MKLFITTILWATFLLGCGGNHSIGGQTSNARLQGNWHLNLTSSLITGTFTVDIFILQTGTTVSSSRIALQPTCSSSGTMNGTVNDNKVNLAITGNSGDTVAINGIVSDNAFTGDYSTKTSGCGVNDDMGSVSAVLIPSMQSASWTGTTASTQYTPGNTTFTANLTEDNSANITAILTFTGSSGSSSSCPSFATGPFTGSRTGNILFLSDNQADGLSLGGTADDAAKNITGQYFVSICSGDNGTIMMSRP